VNIGQVFGCLIGGYCGGTFGPKRTILCSGFPAIFGWLCLALSPNLGVLIFARVVCGVTNSIAFANCSMLVAQYSSADRRGVFLSLYTLMVGVGILLIYSLGSVLYWRYVACVPPVLYLFMILGLLLVPESPIWLISHKGKAEAKKSLILLRASEEVDTELEALEQIREKQANGLTMITAVRNLSRPDIWRPVILTLANFSFVNFVGPFAIIFYGIEVFEEVGIDANEHLAAIVVAAIRVIGGIVAILLIRRMPRLKHVTISMNLMCLSMATLGCVMYLKDLGIENQTLRILPIICLTLYMFSFGAGTGPLQWVFMGELLPPDYKVLSGIITCVSTMEIFIITKIFPTLLVMLKPYGTYWLFAGISLASNVFYATHMPETKDLTMLEIRKLFLANTN